MLIDFSDLNDAQIKAEYAKVRSDFLKGTVMTGGNAGESGFSRQAQVDVRVRLYALFKELKNRGLTALPLPIARTTARFRDPISPI
jgi:hypothetical protein